MSTTDVYHLKAYMNYLAHAYLSFDHAEILLGNMMSDFIKGRKQHNYSAGIFNGIQLHRSIDAFTDAHDATKQLKEFFKPHYKLFAAPISDVIYDYFLANDPHTFPSEQSLLQFSIKSYALLDAQLEHMEPRFRNMYAYMKTQNWLYHYHTETFIATSLEGMRRRAPHLAETHTAFTTFRQYKGQMKTCCDAFFPDVKIFVASQLERLLK